MRKKLIRVTGYVLIYTCKNGNDATAFTKLEKHISVYKRWQAVWRVP